MQLNALTGRLGHLRALGRARRRRIQLPLAGVGVVVAIVGLGASVLRAGGPSSGIGMVLGAWLILLSVMPTAARSIGVTIAVMIGLRTAAALASAIPLLRPCSPLNTAVNCDAFRAVSAAILAIHGAANCYSVYVGVLLLTYRFAMTGRIACLRLTGWPPRAALDALWRAIGVEMVLVGLGWLVLGGLEQLEPRLNGSYGPETNLAPTTRAAIRFALGLELVVLGGLALWPRLRTAVQFKFASIGEGVAAAAGIAAWLGADGHSDAQIFSRAVDTFRSVRCDQLQPHHLDTNEPAAEAYALSSGAQLGSVDAFLSHSWHDDPSEKWRLLQVWRERFVKAHRREPTLWLDRCCIDPSHLTTLLPCLPIYLAGCDTLVGLRGPTYLTRLWCVIEMIDFEMTAAATRIEMIDFGGMPPYASEGQTAQHSELVHVTPSRSSRLFDRGTRRRMPSTTAAADSDGGAAPTARLSRFDVREARCAVHADEDALRSAIESCGAGVDAFNAWMHDMLVACAANSAGTGRHSPLRHADHRRQRGSAVAPMSSPLSVEMHH